MTQEEALEFLQKHQPMLDDTDIEQEVIDKYDEARKFFLNNFSKDCIPLFLNSFGKGSGFGVYQLVGDVLNKFDKEDVVPYLQASLLSLKGSVSYWSVQIAANFPDQRLIKPLAILLNHSDTDVRYFSILALEQIGGKEIRELLKRRLELEGDEEIQGLIEEILDEV